MKTFIYGLLDPRKEFDHIRYIGKSDNPIKRFKQHINESKRKINKNKLKENWITDLITAKLSPMLVIIEKVNCENWQKSEKYWIKHYRELYGDLIFNITDGGERNIYSGKRHPMYKKTHTKEAKKKIGKSSSIRNKGINNPNYGKQKFDSPQKKIFEVMFENGKKLILDGQLLDFRKKYNFGSNVLSELIKGERKKYRGILSIIRIEKCYDESIRLDNIPSCIINEWIEKTQPTYTKNFKIYYKNGKTENITNRKKYCENDNISISVFDGIRNGRNSRNTNILKIEEYE